MPLVSPQILAGIRSFALTALSDRCSILRKFSGSDGGYLTPGQQVVAADVRCRMREETQRDSTGVVADRQAGRTFWTISVPLGTDLRDGDTVLYNDQTYQVMQLFDANTDKVFMQAALSQIAEGGGG